MSAQQLSRPCARVAAPSAGARVRLAARRPSAAGTRRLVCNAAALEVPAEFTKVRRARRAARCAAQRHAAARPPASRELRFSRIDG